jgi:hypothetical protein
MDYLPLSMYSTISKSTERELGFKTHFLPFQIKLVSI